MSSLTAKQKRAIAPTLAEKNKEMDKARKAVELLNDDYMNRDGKHLRIELDARLKRTIGELCAISEQEEGGAVTERRLVTEALLDLIKKYEEGNGKYKLSRDFEFKE